MSRTINLGYRTEQAHCADGAAGFEMAVVALYLNRADDLGTPLDRVMKLVGDTLTINWTAQAIAALRGGILADYGLDIADTLRGTRTRITLDNPALDFNGDGSLKTLGGDIRFFEHANSGGARETEFFVPASMSDFLLLAAALGTLNAALWLEAFMDLVIPNQTVSYFYTGDDGAEAIGLGQGWNSAQGAGGDDVFFGPETGSGQLFGGLGRDAFSAEMWSAGARIDLLGGLAANVTLGANYELDGFEDAKGSGFRDRIIGDGAANGLFGRDGNDVLIGNGGDDTLAGGNGGDVLAGGAGGDSQAGGDGKDTLTGGDGDDTLDGQGGNDLLQGGRGHDSLLGGGGRDTLEGGTGNDSLDGGGGKDLLLGDEGDDRLTGGAKEDVFLFIPKAEQGDDTITDFDRSEGDRIRFIQNALQFSDLTITPTGDGGSRISYPDGAGGQNVITVDGVVVQQGDFEFFGN